MNFHEMLGMRVVERHEDGLTLECPIRPEFLNGAGVVHGGLTASVADTAMGVAMHEAYGGLRRTVTVELKINYLAAVMEGMLRARASILRKGKTLAVGRVDVRDEGGRLIAVATATFMAMDPLE